MHIPDGVLSIPVVATSAAVAAGAIGIGLRKMDYESIPRVGVMSSVFFVASLIHVRVGWSSAHLLLPGLMGVVLGWAAFPAVAVALLLQAILFGFGGITSLGANVLIMGIPAVACYHIFGRLIAGMRRPRAVFWLAFGAGVAGILFGWAVLAVELLASGREFRTPVLVMLAVYVLLMVIEGFVTASAVSLVHRIRPGMLAARPRARRAGKEARAGA